MPTHINMGVEETLTKIGNLEDIKKFEMFNYVTENICTKYAHIKSIKEYYILMEWKTYIFNISKWVGILHTYSKLKRNNITKVDKYE